MTAPDRDSDFGLLELDRQECLALLGSVPIGRLAYTTGAMPTIVPMTFVVLRPVLVPLGQVARLPGRHLRRCGAQAKVKAPREHLADAAASVVYLCCGPK